MGPLVPATRLLSELAAVVAGEVVGNPNLRISGVNGLGEAGPSELSFYTSGRHRAQLQGSRAAAILVGPRVAILDGKSFIRVANPNLAFAQLSALFHPRPRFRPGISPSAHVHPEARIDATATVLAGAAVERGASVGARSVLFPGVYLGEEAVLGEDCLLYSNVTVRERCVIGSRVILHSSCVIGADGFGFAFDPAAPAHVKVPQIGIVRIEDDVEIGACSCVDRATFGETLIGSGTKIDNLVQIGHNVKVGPLSIVCGQTGISGSTEIGTGVVLAGQVGLMGHIRIGNNVKVGAKAGVLRDLEDGATVIGYPAIDHRQWLRNLGAYEKLAELAKEVRKLKETLDSLEHRVAR